MLNNQLKSLFDDCEGALFLEENKAFLLAEIEKGKLKALKCIKTICENNKIKE